MKKQIDNRIKELKEYVDKMRKLIIPINDDIENGILKPSALQKKYIDHIAEQGRSALAEIKRLERLKKNFD